MNKKESKTFCPLPWLYTSLCSQTLEYKLCCISERSLSSKDNKINFKTHTPTQLLNGPQLDIIRKKMISGEIPNYCIDCFTEEGNGIESMRNIYQKKYLSELQDMLQNTRKDGTLIKKVHIREIELRLGNLCNLKCIMCNPSNSSSFDDFDKIYQDTENNEYPDHEFKELDDNLVLKNIEDIIDTLEVITFRGGEPFINKTNTKVLEHIINKGHAQKISLIYSTNGTYISDKLINLLKQFKSVYIWVSIDGTKSVNDFIRYPSKWPELEKNILYLDKVAQKNFNIFTGLTFTLQAYNAHNLLELLNFSNQLKGSIRVPFINILHTPDFFQLKSISQEKRKEYAEQINQFVSEFKNSSFDILKNNKKYNNENILRIENILTSLNNISYCKKSNSVLRMVTRNAVKNRQVQNISFLSEKGLL